MRRTLVLVAGALAIGAAPSAWAHAFLDHAGAWVCCSCRGQRSRHLAASHPPPLADDEAAVRSRKQFLLPYRRPERLVSSERNCDVVQIRLFVTCLLIANGAMGQTGQLEIKTPANTSPPSRRARARARVEAGNQRPWPADKVERWSIDRLIPYAKNARTHTDAQVAAIAASIREWGWTSPALVDEDGGLIAGHARVLAARQLGIAEVPVMVAAGWTEAQKRAYVLADNQLAITGSGWDPEAAAAPRTRGIESRWL
jgi:ParB-like nuclease domain